MVQQHKKKYKKKKFELIQTNIANGIKSIETRIVSYINTANEKIYISTWLINSEKITKSLLKASQRLKGHVYLITALDQNYFHYRDSDDLNEIEDYNFSRLKCLKGNNDYNTAVEIRGNFNMHAKFLIIDERLAIITSANFTHSSLEIGSKLKFHKNEIGITIKEKSIVKQLSELYKLIFMQYHHAHLRFNDQPIIQKQIIRKSINNYVENFSKLHKQNLNKKNQTRTSLIWTLPDEFKDDRLNNNEIEDSLNQIIQNEEKSIKIVSFSWKDMKSSDIYVTIKKKLNNPNFNLEIILNNPRKTIGVDLKELLEKHKNIKIYLHPRIHAKFIIASNKWALFTANFDTKYGIKNSIEVGLQSNKMNIRDGLIAFFNQMKKESKIIRSVI